MRRLPQLPRHHPAVVAVVLVLGLLTGPALTASGAGLSAAVAASTDRGARPALAKPDQRSNPDFVTLPRACADSAGYPLPGLCRLLPLRRGAPTIVLWGDSHAWQVIPALRRAVGKQRVNLVSSIMGGCPPMWPTLRPASSKHPSNGCDRHGRDVMDWLQRQQRSGMPMRLVVATSWELYHDVYAPPDRAAGRYPGFVNDWITANARRSITAMPRAFKKLGRLHLPTDLVGQMPMVWTGASCSKQHLQCTWPRRGVLKSGPANNERIMQLRGYLTESGRVIRPARSLCDRDTCRGRYRGDPVYFDQLHIGQRRSARLSSYFEPTVRAVLRTAR